MWDFRGEDPDSLIQDSDAIPLSPLTPGSDKEEVAKANEKQECNMRQRPRETAKLPRRLLEELGPSLIEYNGRGKPNRELARRKQERKSPKVQRTKRPLQARVQSSMPNPNRKNQRFSFSEDETSSIKLRNGSHEFLTSEGKVPPLRSISKDADLHNDEPSERPSQKISRTVRDRLVKDNDEIAALERALGVKGKDKLPQAFKDDGLDTLLDGLSDGELSGSKAMGKRKRTESDAWLEKKRRKARSAVHRPTDVENTNRFDYQRRRDEAISDLESNSVDDTFDTFTASEAFSEDGEVPTTAMRTATVRENPYQAPAVSSTTLTAPKYVPPSLRNKYSAKSEDHSRLRRQVQGLLNRLSEANLVQITSQVEELYRTQPRQLVSAVLVDLLLGLISDSSNLEGTFIILHAGFTAAIFKVVGADVGAYVIQRIYESFMKQFQAQTELQETDKISVNLMSLLAELYNFKVVGDILIYDFLHLLLERPSETNIELLLKIVRSTSQQLRQDNPIALKKVMMQIHDRFGALEDTDLSVRSRFMIENLKDLKKIRTKTGTNSSTVISEHTTRMKKSLNSLNQRDIKASEPLRIGLDDLRDSDQRGKWWLVGASFRDKGQEIMDNNRTVGPVRHHQPKPTASASIADVDLDQLAKEQRMNTNIRRSIFVAIMSADDCNDAYIRIMKLRLKKSQELEIPKLLIHCSGAEKMYNPYYTVLSRKICSDRKLRKAFQFAFWDFYRHIDEGEHNEAEHLESLGQSQPSLRSTINVARMIGTLIADGGLGLGVLKTLELPHLRGKSSVFVEVILITTVLQSQSESKFRDEVSLVDVFTVPSQSSALAIGLRRFLTEAVANSDLIGSDEDRMTVRWGCKIAKRTLKAVSGEAQMDDVARGESS